MIDLCNPCATVRSAVILTVLFSAMAHVKKIWKQIKRGISPKPPAQPLSPDNPADIPAQQSGFTGELVDGPQGRDRRHRNYW